MQNTEKNIVMASSSIDSHQPYICCTRRDIHHVKIKRMTWFVRQHEMVLKKN